MRAASLGVASIRRQRGPKIAAVVLVARGTVEPSLALAFMSEGLAVAMNKGIVSHEVAQPLKAAATRRELLYLHARSAEFVRGRP
jgi:hypothetical protein